MATETRTGFRLPWTAGTGEAGDQATPGETPVAEENQEADMIEIDDSAQTAEASDVTADADERAQPDDASDPAVAPDAAASQPARRATKFMAELSRAMQVAAENARGETMARFEVEAKGVVEDIHAAATEEAADLRRKADDDVAAIREWSKSEIARIREETEARIATRKGGLDVEVEQHGALVEARIERVATVVSAFEAEMAAFFERLNAEEDPTRIATMAETMPDPPSLADVVAALAAAPPTIESPTEAPTGPATGEPMSADDFAAAEAEAAAFNAELEGDDEPDAAPTETTDAEAGDPEAAAQADPPPAASDLTSTRVVVAGLVSVANIANFKRSLTRTPGIATIAVASGPDGDFVFSVGHTLGADLSASVQALSGFDIEITDQSDDAIHVAALDRDTVS
jgi:hypothetical protein